MITNTGCGRRAQSPNIFCGANKATRIAKCVKDRTGIAGLIPAADVCPVLPIFQGLGKAGHSHRRRTMTAIVRRAHTAIWRDRIESFLLTWRDQSGSRITALYGELPTEESGQLLLVHGVSLSVNGH